MTNDAEEFDQRVARRLRDFSDRSVAKFDADRVAAVAMAPTRPRLWQLAASADTVGTSPPSVEAASPSEEAASPSEASPTQSTPAPTLPGLTQQQAVAAARAAAPQSADRPVLAADAGTSSDLLQPRQGYEFAATIPSDRWVWVINLGEGSNFDAQGSIVVIDFLDGRVYGVMDWRS